MNGRTVVTGGFGFIGSAFIRRLSRGGGQILNVDLGTYAGDERRLDEVPSGTVRTIRADVADRSIWDLFRRERPAVIVHFAAETHVTRSEGDAGLFYRSNVEGTRQVFEAAVRADAGMLVHVSTDEVYGPCLDRPFREAEKVPGEGRATSAYARSKAVADDLARSFFDRLPVILVRPTNCFGPWQHPEKAIARWATRALLGERIPVWGDGGQIRDWMFVDDACAGIEMLIARGTPGEAYNLGPQGPQRTNLEIARLVARAAGRGDDAVYLTAYDRPQHDRRYAVDCSKVNALGWRPATGLERGIGETVDWYRGHRDWWTSLLPEAEQIYSDAMPRGE
jgi:dTDP-glucose 4,6-dehydratase